MKVQSEFYNYSERSYIGAPTAVSFSLGMESFALKKRCVRDHDSHFVGDMMDHWPLQTSAMAESSQVFLKI